MSRHVAAVLFLSSVCGCATISQLTGHPAIPHETKGKPAVKCLCLWEEGTGNDARGVSSRGFVGQIYFFCSNDPSPVVVDGDVRIFLFDDAGSDEEQSRPQHQFDYVNGAWNAFQVQTEFGVGYSVFVPYPENGNQQASCSLRLRLSRPDNSRLFSEMAVVSIGRPSHGQRSHDGSADAVAAAEELPQKVQLKSETIGMRQDGKVFLASGTQSEDSTGNAPATNRAAARQNRLREILDEVKREKQLEQPAVVDVNISARELFEGQPEQQTATSTPDPIPDTTTDELPEVRIQTLSRPLTRKPSSQSDTEPVESDQP